MSFYGLKSRTQKVNKCLSFFSFVKVSAIFFSKDHSFISAKITKKQSKSGPIWQTKNSPNHSCIFFFRKVCQNVSLRVKNWAHAKKKSFFFRGRKCREHFSFFVYSLPEGLNVKLGPGWVLPLWNQLGWCKISFFIRQDERLKNYTRGYTSTLSSEPNQTNRSI